MILLVILRLGVREKFEDKLRNESENIPKNSLVHPLHHVRQTLLNLLFCPFRQIYFCTLLSQCYVNIFIKNAIDLLTLNDNSENHLC